MSPPEHLIYPIKCQGFVMSARNDEHRTAVRHYYDRNTPRFLRYGAQRQARTIHRAVWVEGVQNGQEALQYSNRLVLRELASLRLAGDQRTLRVADLGCGVGASIFYLVEGQPGCWGLGVTISPVQALLARQEAAERRLDAACAFVVADFQSLPVGQTCEAACAIEAFAHASDARRFFQAVAGILKPGGRLMLCDDFLAEQNPNDAERQWLGIFRWGWGVPSVLEPVEAQQLAAEAGLDLRSDTDLTSNLRLRALPGWLTRMLVRLYRLAGWSDPYWRSVLGGQALQQCYRLSLVNYRFMVYVKT
jgi:cyclopropane fatty-acyl-phospholipid synthase-like methyltransferase